MTKKKENNVLLPAGFEPTTPGMLVLDAMLYRNASMYL